METRRLNEANIGLMTLGKMAELGRQLNFVTNKEAAAKMAAKMGVKPEVIEDWGNGYIAFDAIISITGVLAILQGIRKNRKGAGRASVVLGGTTIGYGIYYLLYVLIGLKDAKSNKLVDIGAAIAHSFAGVLIFRFAQRALA